MTPQTVCLRADPARVRVSIGRAMHEGRPVWRVTVQPAAGSGRPVVTLDDDPVMATTDALRVAAMFAGMPGIDLDGAEFPHPQRRAP